MFSNCSDGKSSYIHNMNILANTHTHTHTRARARVCVCVCHYYKCKGTIRNKHNNIYIFKIITLFLLNYTGINTNINSVSVRDLYLKSVLSRIRVLF